MSFLAASFGDFLPEFSLESGNQDYRDDSLARRLALSKGRTIVGTARGYQSRWLNQMAQKLHIQGTSSDQGKIDPCSQLQGEQSLHFMILDRPGYMVSPDMRTNPQRNTPLIEHRCGVKQ